MLAAVFAYVPCGHHASGAADNERLLSRAREDAQIKVVGIVTDVGSGEETAHAVPEQDVGHVRVLDLHFVVECLLVPNDLAPAIRLVEPDELGGIVHRLSVPEMVVAHGDKAVLRQKLREIVVAGDMLRHAVDHLHDADRLGLRLPQPAMDAVPPVGGGKMKILDLSHGKVLHRVI